MRKTTIILFLTMPQEGRKPEDRRLKSPSGAECVIHPVCIEQEKWQQRLVPWTQDGQEVQTPLWMETVRKKTPAGTDIAEGKGDARELLQELLTVTIPDLCDRYGMSEEETDFVIAGYSLAGLFSLWSLYVTDVFSAAISCSGSLWYPGFREFVLSREPRRNCRIYLSLGTKEEKSGNQQMRTVGDATRAIYEHLQKVRLVEDVVLEWNPGTHFTDVEGRMEKGFAWILDDNRV